MQTYLKTIALLLFLSPVFLSCADTLPENSDSLENEKKTCVIYQNPARYFYDGLRVGADWNIQDRQIFHAFVKQSLAWSPTFYFLDQFDNQLGAEYRPVYFNDVSVGIQLKNFVGKYSKPFSGYYFLLDLENGRRWEKFMTRLDPLFRYEEHFNQFKYTRFGIGFGRQWSVYNRGVLDVNIGFGYNDIRGSEDRYYRLGDGLDPIDDGFFGMMNLSLGLAADKFGRADTELLQKGDTFNYALTLDLGTILIGGMELELMLPSGPKNRMSYSAGYGKNTGGGLNLFDADYWFYTFSTRYINFLNANGERQGPYLGVGFKFYKFQFNEPDLTGDRHAQHIMASFGVITNIKKRILVDAFVQSGYIYRKDKDFETIPIPMLNSGTHTQVGLKFGFANLHPYESEK